MPRARDKVDHHDVASLLLSDGLLLTALELHTELLEAGREVAILQEFFSTPANFVSREAEAGGSPGHLDISRSASQLTLDSIDQITRYSEDGEHREDERIAVLEYELRAARETISGLRTTLNDLAAGDREDKSESKDSDQDEEQVIKPHEQKAINFLLNDYLVRSGFKFTAITFSDECTGQDFEDWDEVGAKPPDILKLYRDFGHGPTSPNSEHETSETQTEAEDLEMKEARNQIQELENIVKSLSDENKSLKEKQDASIVDLEKAEEKLKESDREKEELLEKVKSLSKVDVLKPGHPEVVYRQINPEVGSFKPDIEREDGDGASVAEETPLSPATDRVKDVNELEEMAKRQTDDSKEHPSHGLPRSLSEIANHATLLSPRPVTQSFQLHLAQAAFPVALDFGVKDVTREDGGSSKENDALVMADILPSIITLPGMVNLLADVLPGIISSLVLAARQDVVPLLLVAISRHQHVKTRDNLIGILFNLVKRPDSLARQKILLGFVWLTRQPGWTDGRVEEELLPPCWEQLAHKYQERRLLVAQAAGILAGCVTQEIRGSLVLGMISQLVEDKDAEVRCAAIRSLALLVNLLEDEDKLSQVIDLVLPLVKKVEGEDMFRDALEETLLPVVNMWAIKQHAFNNKIMDELFNDLINSLELLGDDSSGQEPALKTPNILVRKLAVITKQVPFMVYSVISSCPTQLQELETYPENPPNAPTTSPPTMTLGHLLTGSQEVMASFSDLLSQEWFQTWPQLDWTKQFFSKVADFCSHLQLSSSDVIPNDDVIKSCGKLVSVSVEMFGPTFGRKFIWSILEERVLLPDTDQYDRLVEPDFPYAIIPVLVIALCDQKDEDVVEKGLEIFNKWLTVLCIAGVSLAPVIDTIRYLCEDGSQCRVVDSLRECVASHVVAVRVAGAGLLDVTASYPAHQDILARRLVPALVSLAGDLEMVVRAASVAGLVTILASPQASYEIKEKVNLQLGTLIEENSSVILVEIVRCLGRLLPGCATTRDHFLLPLLAVAAGVAKDVSGPRQEVAKALFTAYSFLPGCNTPEPVVRSSVLPGIAALLELVQEVSPDLEASVLQVMSEVEVESRGEKRGDQNKERRGSDGLRERRDSSLSLSRIPQSMSFESGTFPWKKGGEGETGKGEATPGANSEVRTRMNKIFHKSGNVPFWKK